MDFVQELFAKNRKFFQLDYQMNLKQAESKSFVQNVKKFTFQNSSQLILTGLILGLLYLMSLWKLLSRQSFSHPKFIFMNLKSSVSKFMRKKDLFIIRLLEGRENQWMTQEFKKKTDTHNWLSSLMIANIQWLHHL